MIDIQETIRGVSVLSFLLYVLKRIQKVLSKALSIPTPPPPQSDSSFVISRETCFSSENHFTMKSEKQILGVNGSEKNNLSCVYKGNVLPENVIIEIDSARVLKVDKAKGINMARNRPTCLVIPKICPAIGFIEEDRRIQSQEIEVQGSGYFLASKKGKKEVMEDSYGILLNILDDPKQAFFAVIDGHGGRAAADYIAKHLGENIVKELNFLEDNEVDNRVKTAINGGYLATDKEFLSQGLNGGACVASVLISRGQVHIANVGDCRVVLSRNGVARTLTTDHRLSREDERHRIENTGGYVHCRKGVWRVNGSLAVSRAIGDRHLKNWVISEPDVNKFSIATDCEFLILASDGLWDTVNDQEVVDVVAKGENEQESCKKLLDISFSRGNKDDATVMIVNLQQFAFGL